MVVIDVGQMAYWPCYKLQEELVSQKIAGARDDYLVLVEHPHVYTTGRGGDVRNLPAGRIPVFRINRGGDVTYHGPGQVVCYPIVALAGYGTDIHRYVRALEGAVIETLGGFGISGSRRSGLTGVWVEDRKIAAIGIGARRWVTRHGLAINVSCDISYFERIVPCGIEGARITSMAKELGRSVELKEVKERLASACLHGLSGLRSKRLEVIVSSASAGHSAVTV